MLTIIFTIFKIIGVILLLILLLLALILLVPIRYRFFIEKERESLPDGAVYVSWFMFLFTLRIEYINQKFRYTGKILGHQILGNQPSFLEKKEEKEQRKAKKEKKKKQEAKQKKKAKAKKASAKEEETKAESANAQRDMESSKTGSKEGLEAPPEETSIEDAKRENPAEKGTLQRGPEERVTAEEEAEKGADKEDAAKKDKAKTDKKGIKDRIGSLSETIAEWKEKYEEYHLSKLIPFLKDVALRLLKHLLPYRLNGDLSLGFDDPSLTGYVTAALALGYPVYGKSFCFYPDFQEEIFEANCKGRGRIRIIYILYLLVILLLNKDVRTIIFD